MIEPGKLYNLYLKKGRLEEGFSLVLWDSVSPCSAECVLHKRCPYKKTKLCKVEIMYLNSVTKPVMASLQVGHLTQAQWLDFGLKLVPLFHDLVRIKKMLIDADTILVEKGSTRINPLFSEKRKIIRCIESLEITKELRGKFAELGIRDPLPSGASELEKDDDEEHMMKVGDPDYVAALSNEPEDDDRDDILFRRFVCFSPYSV